MALLGKGIGAQDFRQTCPWELWALAEEEGDSPLQRLWRAVGSLAAQPAHSHVPRSVGQRRHWSDQRYGHKPF